MLNLGFSAIFSLFVTIGFFVITTELVGLISSLAFTVLISATVFLTLLSLILLYQFTQAR